MRVVLGLLALGWLAERPWVQVLVAGVILVGLAIFVWVWMQQLLETEPSAATWTRVEPRFEPWPTQDQSFERPKLLRRIEQLEHDLEEARGTVETLRAHNEQLERDLQIARTAKPNSRSSPLFRRVGLDEDVPEWVARAVRREYRKRLHPDGRHGSQKVEAERRFKEAEGVFDQIWRTRGFRS